jgi:tRNA(Ile)-lysidine synthase
LYITRNEIEEYCRYNSLSFRSDSSNFRNIYTRNKLRNIIIPHIDSTLGIDTVKKINSMCLLVKDENDFLEQSSTVCYNECVRDKRDSMLTIGLEQFNGYHPAVKKRILRKAVCDIRGNLMEIESIHIEDALKLCSRGRTGSVIHLPGALRICRSYDTAIIYIHRDNEESAPFCRQLTVPGSTYAAEICSLVISSLHGNDSDTGKYKKTAYDSHVQYFDYEKSCSGLCIRSRKKGDRFSPIGMKGTKKLKDYLIDEKIPRYERNTMPFIAAGNEIVWVIGKRTSERFKVTGETKTVLRLEYIAEGETGGNGF